MVVGLVQVKLEVREAKVTTVSWNPEALVLHAPEDGSLGSPLRTRQ